MKTRFLTTPGQRARGAMFRPPLQDSVLVFVYPHPAPRLFHTFCCPPLRILALSRTGEMLFNQVLRRGRFVRLPATTLIIEIDPALELSPAELHQLARMAPEPKAAVGAWQVNTSLDRLLFALLREAVADLRRVHQAHERNGKVSPEVLRAKFAPWERGQLTGSAGFLLDFSVVCEIPETAVRLARQLLRTEAAVLDELAAAAVAGQPWLSDFPTECLRCGKAASWRPVLRAPAGLAPEAAWRYARPENHFPLCRRCAQWLGWAAREKLRLDLVQGLWGLRFAALATWHQAAGAGKNLVEWDRQADPLWPREFGGPTWATGSGARADAEPRTPYGVARTTVHQNVLWQALNGRGGWQRKRGRGQFVPWQPLRELLEGSSDELSGSGR